ncbi:aminotransferase family protein-like protein [Lasiosphaeris hirsuta]|uniref:Aminotransferase family protein-like protein n=1 Tax=Lasiosphaeris hirsuta TaxID=260670 RepID=A0AA39ZVN8_9PEZI|nr:aminotransferase family protein-like protein [Lasiosphaeris hirsuta]
MSTTQISHNTGSKSQADRAVTPGGRVAFGREMRRLFNFAPSYTPLNHGSFGTFPRSVLERRFKVLQDWEERECITYRFDYPERLRESRALVAPLLGAHVDELVLIPNATTGVNTILRNLVYEKGDVIVYPATIYSACLKVIQHLEETTPVRRHGISIKYPIEDDDLVELFKATAKRLTGEGHRVRAAVFDTIASRPGVRIPWERIVKACKELGILSVIDGAHAIGHLDMTHTGTLKPDFLVTNLHKWLFVPRGCAVLYVPFANQHLFKTALPTSHGFLNAELRPSKSTNSYFVELFKDLATVDTTPYLLIPEALRFRDEVCGGEGAIRAYCARIARQGGDIVARILGTEVLDNKSGSLRWGAAFANVRLPIPVVEDRDVEGTLSVADIEPALLWLFAVAAEEYDTYFQTFFFQGVIWTRLSAQVYLDIDDFSWAGATLKELSARLLSGEWKTGGAKVVPPRHRLAKL